MSLSSIPRSLRNRIFQRDGGRCRYCRLAQVGQAAIFHINHIIPKSRGGMTEEANLALQCPYCSLHKSDKVTGLDAASGNEVALFHPLTQTWDEHFALSNDGRLRGNTPTGAATIAALRMNDPLPRVARSLQIRFGLLASFGVV